MRAKHATGMRTRTGRASGHHQYPGSAHQRLEDGGPTLGIFLLLIRERQRGLSYRSVQFAKLDILELDLHCWSAVYL